MSGSEGQLSAAPEPVAAAVAAGAGRWARLCEYVDWRANPVLVKDLRLWMRGRGFIFQYFLLIAAIVVGSALYTIAARADFFDGRVLWSFLDGGVLVICGAAIPFMVYERFRQELKNRATELAMLSELSARRIVRGKLLSAWCSSILVISAAAPAYATAYLLGGIDVLAALYSALIIVTTILCTPCVQLMLAALGQNAPVRLLSGLVILGQVVGAISAPFGLYELYSGLSELSDWRFWGATGYCCVAAMLGGNFFYQVAVSRLRGVSENREYAPRLALFLLTIVGGALLLALLMQVASPSAPFSWEIFCAAAISMSVTFGIGFLFICGTAPDELPLRLQAGWRFPALVRLLLYPGLDRLCAFVLFHYVLIIAPPLVVMFKSGKWQSEWFNLIIVPYLLIGGGLALHRFVILPLAERTGWRPSELATIIGANIVVAVFAALAAVLCYAADTGSAWKTIALAFSPITALSLAGGGFRHLGAREESLVMIIWLSQTGGVTFFLLLASFRGWRAGLRLVAARRSNSQYRVVR